MFSALREKKIADEAVNTDLQRDHVAHTVVLMLAAGRSRRFGGDKRQAALGAEKTLLEQSISQFTSLGLRVFVSLSTASEDDLLAKSLVGESVEILRCERAIEGMGGTLAESVKKIGDTASILIALADMPGLSSETILQLLEKAQTENIVSPVYEGRRGHPVIFGRRFLPLLKNLSGDAGASQLIREYASSCVSVPVTDAGVVRDVDTAADLVAVKRWLQTRSS